MLYNNFADSRVTGAVGLFRGEADSTGNYLGEGYAAQNSATLTVGISHSEAAESIKVSWPSGKVTEVTEPTQAGSSVIIRERH